MLASLKEIVRDASDTDISSYLYLGIYCAVFPVSYFPGLSTVAFFLSLFTYFDPGIINSLDFLRSSAELTNWYGRTYVYCGNPLMLPFKYEAAYAQLGFEGKVSQNRVSYK